MTDKEVMKQALEALIDAANVLSAPMFSDAATALRTALEQPEPKPTCPECKAEVLYECVACSSNNYPPKPEQEPVAWMVTYGGLTHIEYTLPSKVVDTHYQPLYITPPAAKWDTPSASFNDWWNGDYDDSANPFEKDSAAYWAWAGWKAAQRPWVGLTDAEKKTFATAAGCTEDDDGHIVTEIFRLAETKLKEKNDH